MRTILFVIPNLEFSGAARQLTLLASGLPGARFTRHVCVLGRAGPWAEDLRRAGVTVEVFGWSRAIDPRPFVGLRKALAQSRPDVLHAWGTPALRLCRLLGIGGRAPVVVSYPLPPARVHTPPGLLDRWLLARAERVAVHGPAEAERCRRLGVRAQRLVEVPPGVAVEDGTGLAGTEVRRSLGIPETAQLLVGVGPLGPGKGFRDAIWALDILHSLYPRLHLLLIGAGLNAPRLRRFARTIGMGERVHFTGPRHDVPALLSLADVAWAPDRAGASINAVLEVMAAGRAVVASDTPGLREVVVEGETGLLAPPGNKALLARQTRRLLEDPERRRHLGDAGRRRAVERFSAAALVENWARVYDGLG